ncbi:MAG: T9SS type A sorting domain-containing protein [Candidatus Fermentibacteraceae bacterium]|nr:T9SS type A sorting domain-containing protein [Candidatus Fermentibacteraceae bacterium]MBN2609170.1 T9SS type A sorting domain-containing protein [Candidatus Fermentibacteraceae bacterium]
MKYLIVMAAFAMAAGAAGYSTATMVEVTPEGTFTAEASIPACYSTDAEEGCITDSELLWHYSIVSGLTQKTACMGDDGGYVFSGGWYGGGLMFEGISGDGTVLWQTEPVLGSGEYWKNLATGTASAYYADAFYLVRNFDIWNDNGTPGVTGDDYLVSEDNVEVCLFDGASSTPVWTWDPEGAFLVYSPDEPGSYDCTEDGEYFAVGGYIDGHLGLAVFVPDSANPMLLWDDAGFAYSPRQLRITGDGSKVIFSVGADLLRVDVATGTLEDTYNLGASTDCFDISADGSLVAYGFTSARLAQWGGSEYTMAWSHSVAGYYAGAAAVSDDGQAVYHGFYSSSYLTNRIYRFDPASSTPLWTYDTPTGSGSNQDVVSWMECSSDGSYVAMSSWGCQSGGGDEVIVLDDDAPTAPIYSINTPGSMWYVEISPDGTYITAAGKHVHANVMGSGADVYMADASTQGLEEPTTASLLRLNLSPNPCQGAWAISFSLPRAGEVELCIYDLTGHMVQHLTGGSLGRGSHSIPVSTDLPSGLYIVNLSFDGERIAEKLLISR